MKQYEFNTVIENAQKRQNLVLKVKGDEYSDNNDRFRDFNLIALRSDVKDSDVYKVLLSKHLVSVYHLLDGNLPLSEEMINEKCGDAQNYLLLIEGILRERMKDEKKGVKENERN